MHISDLHRPPRDPISNAELISALVRDRDRYIDEEPSIEPPQAIVISGDIIQGVPLHTDDFASRIEEQYSVAEEFLDELACRFVDGDRSRVVIVPGNHDVDWNTAFSALEPVPNGEIPRGLRGEPHAEDSLLRWDWKTLSLFRIADSNLYNKRLEAFRCFFNRFYVEVLGPVTVQDYADTHLYNLCDDRIGVAAYNSCYGNDCFAFHGMIQQGSIARSDLDLKDLGKVHDLRIAVWHHGIEGSPYRNDYMDVDVVRGMIGRGFRLGLHGHQHKAQAIAREIRLPDQERMAVVGAGSLCAGAYDLPVGTHRQYNVLEIAEDFCSVRVHVRAMMVANLFSRLPLIEFGGKSYFDLDWKPPQNAVGGKINVLKIRKDALINEAEAEIKAGNATQAITILKSLDELSPGSYERQLYLNALVAVQDWEEIVAVVEPPTTIEELVRRFDAHCRLQDFVNATNVLDRFSQSLGLSESLETELRKRAIVKEVMKR